MDNYKDLTFQDFFNGNAREFMKRRVLASDLRMKEGRSFDDFGADPETIADSFTVFLFFYKFYFRVEVHGIENVPVEGPGLIVSNHAPILPLDATMLATAMTIELEKPRLIRTIVNKTISSIPYFSTLLYRNGQVIGCDDNVRRIFENNNLVLVFPTGAEGRPHSIFNKYKMDEFTLGFMEYALKYRTPIIPTCVTGSEEAAMTLGELNLPVAGFKHLPLTPIFPWLGFLGLMPFPSKFDIWFDPPVDYFTEHAHEADNPDKVRELVDDLHDRVQGMLDTALGRK